MSEAEFNPDLTFVHLSDIHFRKGVAGDVHDPDADLRNELEIDLRTVHAERLPKIDGIIISGDIAYSGHPQEFDFATAWINKVSELVNCPEDKVMTTPGNHDVDRAFIPDGGEVDDLHKEIRAASNLAERDEIIAAVLRDPDRGSKLFGGMSAYNDFARQYKCDVTPQVPFWERCYPLGNKGSLLVRGITSTLISGPRDHAQTHKVTYGAGQRTLKRQDNVRRLVVGHHPPSWTLEGDDADRDLSSRSVVQLFGHKHDSWHTKMDGSVRIIAGAVHPERKDIAWEPRYSLLALKLVDRRFHMRIYPRKWSREERTFIGDFNSKGRDFRDYDFD